MTDIVHKVVMLWSVIDPIGTVPVFLAVTAGMASRSAMRKIALQATLVAAGVLLFFVIAGELILDAMGIPLTAFQIAGGLVLFLFALTMIFGDSKVDEEKQLVPGHQHSAVFPLAIPSIASPGAMTAAVLLTDNQTQTIADQAVIAAIILAVLLATLLLLLLATHIQRLIGDAGAAILSRVMGLLLAAVAINLVLEGVVTYFGLTINA